MGREQRMNKEQILLVKHDLEYLLEVAEKAQKPEDLIELQKSIKIVCQRDLRILGRMK